MINVFGINKPVIGMVHVKPLPGTGRYQDSQSVDLIVDAALADAMALQKGGVHGLLIENAGSGPYRIGQEIDPMETAMLSVVAAELQRNIGLPFGLSISTNGVMQAIAVAKATHGSFVRATGWVNGYYSSAGFVRPCATDCIRYRKMIDADDIKVFADIKVKNGSHHFIEDKALEEQARDAQSAMADAVILTGASTGAKPEVNEIERLKNTLEIPVIVGSGATSENIKELYLFADAFIVGTGFKEHKKMTEPVLVQKVKEFMAEYAKLGGGVK